MNKQKMLEMFQNTPLDTYAVFQLKNERCTRDYRFEPMKRLEKLGLVTRSRQEHDERNLFVSLTEAGEALKEEAVKVPGKMAGCVNLPVDELIQLKQLLDKALNGMEEEK